MHTVIMVTILRMVVHAGFFRVDKKIEAKKSLSGFFP